MKRLSVLKAWLTMCIIGLLALGSMLIVGCGGSEKVNSGGEQRSLVSANESGIKYADLDKPEALAWGPPGIFAVNEGYAVPDNVRGVIVIFDDSFRVVRNIPFQGSASAILAVVQSGADILALDATYAIPKILRIDEKGQISSSDITIASEAPPSGMVLDEASVVLEYGGGEKLYRVTEQGSSFAYSEVSGYTWNGKVYSTDKPDATYTHKRVLRFGDKVAVINVADHLGGVQLLGSDGKGGVILLVDNVKLDGVVAVEQTLIVVDSVGSIQSATRMPLENRLTVVSHGVALSRAGQPIVLIPLREGVQFLRPAFGSSRGFLNIQTNPLPGELSKARVSSISQSLVVSPPCLTPAQMNSNALEYLNNSTYISTTSINNDASCGGSSRGIPRYLGGAGTYGSVSYNWNGFDTPAEFNSFMAQNKKAGNYNQIYLDSCAKGVDCSGFVSRVWGFTYKLSTNTIPYHVKPYCPVLALGDVLNKAGSHVVVFVSNATNGIYTYESTDYQNNDKVVYLYRSWSFLAGYTAYRSETSCTP